MRTGIYIHYPFCLKKCLYCDFNSAASSTVGPEQYVSALLGEMELRQRLLPGPCSAPTLYFGGGTPSLMSPPLVGRLIEATVRLFGLESDAEVTLEANPGTLTPDKLSGFRAAGVNRLSLGVQSFEDRLLARLGRVHTAREAVDSFRLARRAGFDNISIDLMHSLPEQSLPEWRAALQEGIALGAEHVSAYALTVEDGTPFALLQSSGELPLPPEEWAARMFESTCELLTAAGYRQYEISNFALPGRASRHNSAYWSRQSYLGFGAGAHSLYNTDGLGHRWKNAGELDAYLTAVSGGRIPEEEGEELSVEDAVSESFFLGLRMLDGLDLAPLEARYGEKPLERHLDEVARLEKSGLLLREGSRIRLAPHAVILANTVFSRFL
ncbi:radical SAM family heme chaperone HemW [Geomonas sp.]|uniref:radical SAM family heme chaperone HemW n=1 Tax=Geomonas sp. TaxID=2651584 RepID=UPI002B4A7D31|nr:radical SAM family heme chaperone HemW [Geomonas sp.]